jgi:trans-aconitate methyltransferase
MKYLTGAGGGFFAGSEPAETMDTQPQTSGPSLLPRETFDEVAQLYDAMRPSYPEAVCEDVAALVGGRDDPRLLEIGCGTGHATRAFAERGFRIHCVELGEKLAAVARRNLAGFERVTIEVANFDAWTAGGRFDLVYSASAFHWLNRETREERIAALLDRGGTLAVWRNHHVRNGSSDEFIDATEQIYEREAPALVKKRIHVPRAADLGVTEEEKLTSALFEAPEIRVYFWRKSYAAAEYVRMMSTHSDHRLLPESQRRRLLSALEELIERRFGGSVTSDYATLLEIARKRG